MDFERELTRWDYRLREKRFFMHGTVEGQTAHCANTGSLKGVLENCSGVWVHDFGPGGTRKLQYSAEVCELKNGVLVGINTMRANGLARDALLAGMVPEVGPIDEIKVEAKWDAATRFDLKFGDWWGEVKNTTLAEGAVAMFPDAKTERGRKHLGILTEIVEQGGKAIQIYVVPRTDVTSFKSADMIDPLYGEALRKAVKAGVLVVALGCKVTSLGIVVDRRLEVVV